MKLSIIIPAYNEKFTIREIIRRVKSIKLIGLTKEIIVVNDASYDGTEKILRDIKGIRIINHKINKGKGAAVKSGIEAALGEIILIQDADLEYNPKDFPRLLKPILDGITQVVYGTRLKDYPVRLFGKNRTPLIKHYLGNKLLTFLTNILFLNRVTDMETGYKVFRKSVLDGINLERKRFDFEPEITAKILKRGFSIIEVPIKVKPRGYDEGKKINWKDGIVAVWVLLKYRFSN